MRSQFFNHASCLQFVHFIADLCRILEIIGQILMQVSRFKPVNLVFGFEKFFGKSRLALLILRPGR
jgi:hypothetical protein